MAETPMRFIRIDDDTWHNAQTQARDEGISAAQLVREGLQLRMHQSVDAEIALIIVRLKQLRKRLKGE